MSRHLSSQRISMWAIGERTPDEERHVQECPLCAAEVASLETALSRFRGSVRQWSERQGSAGTLQAAQPRFRWTPARWALAAAALLLVATVPVYRSTRHPQAGPKLAEADVLLLEQVDAQVSQAVPRPMEPLLKLVSWDPLSANDSSRYGGVM